MLMRPVPAFATCQYLRVTDLVVEGAVCNATWCDAVCRSHALPTQWTEDAWTVARRSPDGYPDAVTLSPAADLRAVLGRIEEGAGCSVKDSFAVLDLAPHGFHVLFEATWIRRSAVQPTGPATLDWREVRSPAELARWSRGHELDAFGPALLDSGDLRFYSSGSATGAGFAVNRGGGVVGISNLFAGSADPMVVWSDAVAVATRANPGVDLAGYELGRDLEFALAVGFVQTVSFRVWML